MLSVEDRPPIEDAINPNSKIWLMSATAPVERDVVTKRPSLIDTWYPIAFSEQVTPTEKLDMQIFGEPIVIYRDSNQRAVVARDRCPHRGAPLSLGSSHDGIIQCIYHDWEFGCDGKATRIPGAGSGFIEKVHLSTFPCEERDGVIFIFYGDPAKADPQQVLTFPKLGFTTPLKSIGDTEGNFIHHLENLMDPAHVWGVHKNTMINQVRDPDNKEPLSFQFCKDNRGFIIRAESKDKQFKTVNRFDPPCTFVGGDPEGKLMFVFHVVPVNKNHTRYLLSFGFPVFDMIQKFPCGRDMLELDSWSVLFEDAFVVKGQAIRMKLSRHISHLNPRGSDASSQFLYKWLRHAQKNDFGVDVGLKDYTLEKYVPWFNGWAMPSGNVNDICSRRVCGEESDETSQDLEDLMSQVQMSVKKMTNGPLKYVSVTALPPEYPPMNLTKWYAARRRVRIAKAVVGMFLAGLVGAGVWWWKNR